MSYATSISGTNKVWKKIQGASAEVLPVLSQEFAMLEEHTEQEKTPYSAREVLIPLDINDGYGTASILPGDWEALPSTPNMEELTIDIITLNKRFDAPLLEQWSDKAEAQIKRVLKYKATKGLRAMAREFSDQFYGTSVGTVALTDTDVSGTTATLTLHSGYGQSTISNAAFLASKFKVGETIALVNGSTLVTNGIGTITAVTPATPSIGVTFVGSVTVSDNNLKIVKAASQGHTEETPALAHTQYNKALVGLVDITRTASVHGVSSSSIPDWSVAYADTSGGAFDGVRLRAGEDEMEEWDGKIEILVIDKAVYRDWYRTERSILRHDDPVNMETDGNIKSGKRKIVKTRRAIPAEATGFKKSALRRWSLLPKPDSDFSWAEGMKREDRSALVFSMNMPVALICRNRKHFAYWTGLDRS